ncbi:claudin-1 [Microcaecilia unicolor]|uniref:Claudin n=1 Tax=Microcaecilia unicolor TaxID=1415580 RepID=A0A6P7Z698_9AMPH|nr:claudin-1 [Microcaecilia unicolor]
MANAGLQMLGFVLALVGWIGFIVCTAMPQWKMSSYAGENIVTAQAMYIGLWMSCVMQSTGQMQCKTYDSLLVLDTDLQATRALMICGIFIGFCGMCVAAFGMKCTKGLEDDKEKKGKIAVAGGALFIIAGLAVLIGTAWYGSKIARDFYNPYTPTNTKYEFGHALFIGWAAAVLAIIGGGILCCSCPRRETSYPPPRSQGKNTASGGKDYV